MFRMIVYPCCLKDSSRIGPELEKIALSGKVPDSTGQYRTMIDVFAPNDTVVRNCPVRASFFSPRMCLDGNYGPTPSR